MTKYHRNILIDKRTSCTTDQAAALLLKRRSWDPIYLDKNPDADPEVVHEQFMEWLDISIFEELMEERDGLLMELDDALGDSGSTRDEAQVTLCKERIVQCDDTIRRAHLILCDIDGELAKGAQSRLIKDPVAAESTGQIRLTLASLKQWAEGNKYLTMPLDASTVQIAPPPRLDPEFDESLLNQVKGMKQKSACSFLITFAILLDAFLERAASGFKEEGGVDPNKAAIAKLICKMSRVGAGGSRYLHGQSVTSIEERLKEVIRVSAIAVTLARAKAQESK